MSAAELVLFVLVVASILGVVLQSLLILVERRRKQSPQEALVIATVTRVEEEIKRQERRWFVEAQWVEWVDTETQRTYTFRSPPVPLRPKVRAGDTLVVSFDPRHATRYQMHL
jgi:hypothetical protein